MKLKYLNIPAVLLLTLPICAQTSSSVTQQAQDRELRNNTIENRPNTSPRGYSEASAGSHNLNNTPNQRWIYEDHPTIRNIPPTPKIGKQDIDATSADTEDTKEYGEFLKDTKKTGIVRLQNADVCLPNDSIIEAGSDCPNNIVGKATAFSFRTKLYSTSKLADIFFKGNKLTISGTYALNFMANLGDIPINNFNLNSDGIKQLSKFTPPTDEKEIKQNWETLDKGFQIDDFIYNREAELVVNNTYVLRVIAYQVLEVSNDKRKDIIVVFRPIRKHEDGSISLVWKELSRTNSPKITLESKK